MTLEEIRKEVLKEQDQIDWVSIMISAKTIHRKVNENKSFLGLNRGFINVVRVPSWQSKEYIAELSTIYNPNDITFIDAPIQAKLLKVLKEGTLVNEDTIKNKLIVVLTDKMSIETLLARKNLLFLKFSMSMNSERIENSTQRITKCKWKKQGEKTITWIKGQGVSIKRDNILDELLKQ